MARKRNNETAAAGCRHLPTTTKPQAMTEALARESRVVPSWLPRRLPENGRTKIARKQTLQAIRAKGRNKPAQLAATAARPSQEAVFAVRAAFPLMPKV
jgi:hypothetical protein